jgi:phosphate:Na+ symporter
MELTFLDAISVIGSLGLFIYGIKKASESIQKALGLFLTQLVKIMTKNHLSGILTGFFLTAVVFSSSSTIVMVVSFVNSGIITLVESVSIIFGASIGSTIITWIVSVFGFETKIMYLFIVLLTIGTPLIFSSKNKLKYTGEFIFGVAIVFLALSLLIQFVPVVTDTTILTSFIESIKPLGFADYIFFALIGVLLTIIMQSSVASIVFTQVLCFNGIITFDVAIPLVLGQNFGRTINAELAAMAGNVYAKRTARIHSIINIFGFFWMTILISTLPVLNYIDNINTNLFYTDSVFTTFGAPIGIAVFHSLYNIINTLILIWFIPFLVKLAENNIKSKGRVDETFHLEHLTGNILLSTDLLIFEAQKELSKFGEITSKMNSLTKELITEQNEEKVSEILKSISRYEEITDKMEVESTEFLTKISQGEMSETSSVQIRGMLRIIINMERIGDIYYQMSKTIERKIQNQIWFTPQQRQNILTMFGLIEDAMLNMCENLNNNYAEVSIDKAKELEEKINQFRTKLRQENFENIEQGEYSYKNATVYSELFNSLEKVGDHIINVSEGVAGVL